MAKAHGKKARVYAAGLDLSGFLRMAKRSGDQDLADASTFADDDKTFVVGMQSGSLSLEGIYNARVKVEDAQELSDVLQAGLGVTDLVAVHLPQGDGFGNVGYLFMGDRNSIEVTSPHDDIVKITGEAQSDIGFKRGLSLKAKGEVAGGAEVKGEPIDNGAVGSPTKNGGVGILQVFQLDPAKTLEVKIQHSPDNVTFTDLIAFTAVVGAGEVAQGIVLPKGTTVNRYVRHTRVLASGKSNFSVHFARNLY